MMETHCRICGNTRNNRVHRAREMMFGTREEFDYLECGVCGTLQLIDVPDLARFYPPNYLSFEAHNIAAAKSLVHKYAARAAGKYLVEHRGLLGRIVTRAKPNFVRALMPQVTAIPDIRRDQRILDFGCGSGHLLQIMHYFGFTKLTGADAFIDRDITHDTGVTILKRSLSDLEPEFDVVMLHHSFEHLPDPKQALRDVRRILAKDGKCLLRIPIVGHAWEKYGTNWVQMDPPRHLFLFTDRAIRLLAESAGFTIDKVLFDSDGFQFWGSEQYLRDIPLVPEGGFGGFRPSEIFTAQQLASWDAEAERLNAEGRGDAACFYLSKSA